jgi:Glycoside hydrolase 97.
LFKWGMTAGYCSVKPEWTAVIVARVWVIGITACIALLSPCRKRTTATERCHLPFPCRAPRRGVLWRWGKPWSRLWKPPSPGM